MNEIFLSFFYKYGLKWRTIYAVGDKFDSVILKFTTTVRGDIFCFKQFQEQSSWEINKYYTQFSDDSIKQKKNSYRKISGNWIIRIFYTTVISNGNACMANRMK